MALLPRPLLLTAIVALTGLGACAPDTDRDGTRGRRDCDETSQAVNANAVEVCNGIDDDCDGFIDEGVSTIAYWDRDGDGFGDPAQARRVCVLPADGSLDGSDCDDANPATHPGADETCDLADNDCDGDVDEGVLRTFFVDDDADGHGAPEGTTLACTPPAGFAARDDDCDDADPTAWRDAVERCDGHDNDCDGAIDEGLPSRPVWVDADGDGGGDPARPGLACGDAPGWSTVPSDCDDTDPLRGPGVAEIADNGEDDDCDGFLDEIAVPDHVPTLAAAVVGAVSGDVIQLGPGIWRGTANLRGRDLTLAGQGCAQTTLYGDGRGPVITLSSGRLTGLTVAGGAAPVGAGVLVDGDVSLDHVCVRNNTATERGGGLAVLSGTAAADHVTVDHNRAGLVGGGVFVADDARLDLTASVLRDNTARGGGDLAVGAARAELSGVVIARGHATGVSTTSGRGGGLRVDGARAKRAQVGLTHVTFTDNDASWGQALWADYADVMVENTLLTDHQAARAVVYEADHGDVALGDAVAFAGNAGQDTRVGWQVAARREAPVFVHRAALDLRLVPGSAHVDAGVGLDADASPADLGASGGPNPVDEPVSDDTLDADDDTVPDGWELYRGLLRWDIDASADPDGDGLDNAEEWALRTDPHVADSDADGIGDADDPKPLDPSDQAPVADAGPDRDVLLGDPVALTATSFDPNSDPLTVTWSITAPPGGTAPFAPMGTFTPDAPGTWQLRVDAWDGHTLRSDHALVRVYDALVVPDDAPTPQEAIAAAGPGEAVALRPGAWPGFTVTEDVVVFGTAAGVTVRGQDDAPVIESTAAHLTLSHLTVTSDGVAAHGGGVRATGDLTLREVVVHNTQATGDGGGLMVQGTLNATDVVVRDGRTGRGGGVFVHGVVRWVRGSISDCEATTDGGGIYVDGTPGGRSTIANVVLQGNRARTAPALLHRGVTSGLTLTQSAVVENHGRDGVVRAEGGQVAVRNTLAAYNTGGPVVQRAVLGRVDVLYARHTQNAGGLTLLPDDVNATAPGSTQGPLGVLAWADDGVSDDAWVAELGSPLLNAGVAGDLDIDGSPADIGPGGGPDASRAARLTLTDTDGDGLSDAWEMRHGLDPATPSASEDGDHDGLSNAVEHTLGTAPDQPDTDGDGVHDGDEVTAGTDPLWASDHRPLAAAGGALRGAVGDALTLDGTGSSDPNGDALTYAWSVSAAPPQSALVGLTLSGATPALVPDARGAYRVALRVSDGAATSLPDTLVLTVHGAVRVPQDYPNVARAVPHLIDGDTVVLSAGEHTVGVEDPPVSFTLAGAGQGQTRVHPPAGTPALRLTSGVGVQLRDLTVSGGVGPSGGAVECRDSPFSATRVTFQDNAAPIGGALYLRQCPTTLVDVTVRDNATSGTGGGVYAYLSSLSWTGGAVIGNHAAGNGGGLYVARGDLFLRNVALANNHTASPGGALYATTATADLAFLTVTDNTSNRAAIFLASSSGDVADSLFTANAGVGLQVTGTGVVHTASNGFWDNADGPTLPTTLADGPDTLFADPRLLAPPQDVRLDALSPARDADATHTDPDGTWADLGAYGGPNAPADANAGYADADADGLPDRWEQANGLVVGVNDAAQDHDGDGLDAVAEWLAQTDPQLSDTDGDGLPDAQDPFPLDATGRRPNAIAGPDQRATLGQRVSLSGAASTDPDGVVVGWSWSIQEAPGRSTAVLSGAHQATTTFTPDAPGRYTLSLTVTDGALTSAPDVVVVSVAGDLWVPDDYPTLATATAAASDGATLFLPSGDVTAGLDLTGRQLTLVGTGRDTTRLITDAGGVLWGGGGTELTLTDLTIAGGHAERGAGIWLEGSPDAPVSLTLEHVAVRDGAAVDGGAIALHYGVLTTTDVAVTGAIASRYGGGVYLSHATADLVRALFANDHALAWYGGALYVTNTVGTLDHAVIADCTAVDGGGVFVDEGDGASDLQAQYVTAAGNAATRGAAVWSAHRGLSGLTDSVIAWSSGAALSQSTGVFTIQRTSFWANVLGNSAGFEDPVGAHDSREEDPAFNVFTDNGTWHDDDLRLTPGSPSAGRGAFAEPDAMWANYP